jgi:hypothetical protein
MDADTNVGAGESAVAPQLPDPSSPNQTGLQFQVPFSVTSILILLLGTGRGCLSLAQVLH